MTEPGTLSHGTGGALHISVDAEKYRIEPEDLKNLLFYGRVIPICEDRSRTTPGGILVSEVAIEGHAAMNASGKMKVGYFTQYQVEELDRSETPLQHMTHRRSARRANRR